MAVEKDRELAGAGGRALGGDGGREFVGDGEGLQIIQRDKALINGRQR